MTAAEHDLRDGSKCVVDDDGRMATISRFVDGQRVWGQVFTGSRDDYEQLVASGGGRHAPHAVGVHPQGSVGREREGGQVTDTLRALRERRDRASASFEEAIVAAHAEGTPITRIAAESGLSRQAIYDLLKRHGQ